MRRMLTSSSHTVPPSSVLLPLDYTPRAIHGPHNIRGQQGHERMTYGELVRMLKWGSAIYSPTFRTGTLITHIIPDTIMCFVDAEGASNAKYTKDVVIYSYGQIPSVCYPHPPYRRG